MNSITPMGSEFVRISPGVNRYSRDGLAYLRQLQTEREQRRRAPSLFARLRRQLFPTADERENDKFRAVLQRSVRPR